MTIATSILFAFLCSLLYCCTLGTVAQAATTNDDLEKQAVVGMLGTLLVFVLVLWLRLEAA